VHPKRGKEAIESDSPILRRFLGWLVHDCWSSYFNLTQPNHAVCGAHLLRELQSLIENQSRWAVPFKALLLEIYHQPFEQRLENRQEIEQKYDNLLEQAQEEEPPPIKTGKRGRYKRTKGRNLLERLQKFKPAVLAFAFNNEVPFTNNQAERDIRPIKVKQKISGGFRTFMGSEHYARIAGFISTTRKHKLNVFKELCNAFEGNTFLTLEQTS
jgi:transposase